MKKKKGGDSNVENDISSTGKNEEEEATINEYEDIENIPQDNQANLQVKQESVEYDISKVGGKHKYRKTRKSNGHKQNCNCPICKNMKKNKKTRKNKK